jgi:hypothetical protein
MYLKDGGLTSAEEYMEHRRRLKEDLVYKAQWEAQNEQNRQQWWAGLKPFKEADEVPQLPNPLTPYYIERLIQLGAIPLIDLVDGQWYYGDYRNANLAKWDSQEQVFHHLRYKFGYRWDTCNHFENDDRFALFTPLRLATPDEVQTELSNAPADI